MSFATLKQEIENGECIIFIVDILDEYCNGKAYKDELLAGVGELRAYSRGRIQVAHIGDGYSWHIFTPEFLQKYGVDYFNNNPVGGPKSPFSYLLSPQDYLMIKAAYSNFAQKTQLDMRKPIELPSFMTQQGWRKIIFAGLYGLRCITSAAADARQHGFECLFLSDLIREHDTVDIPDAETRHIFYRKNYETHSSGSLGAVIRLHEFLDVLRQVPQKPLPLIRRGMTLEAAA